MSSLTRKTPMKRGRIKPRGKKYGKKQTKAMGPRARREFVSSLPCAACGVVGYSANAHLLGALGRGIKKDCTTIGPLCVDRLGVVGCHYLHDEERWEFDARFPGFNAERVAAETEARWQAFSGAKS